VGAATGQVVETAAVGAGASVASETFGSDAKADAERMATAIAGKVTSLFERQGWRAAAPSR
jgi:hypothetical protein